MDLTESINHMSSISSYLHRLWLKKTLNFNFDRKERPGFSLQKNEQLSSGILVEDANA